MSLFAKHKIKPYHDTTVFADNEIAQEFKKIVDTPEVRRYTNRRMFRTINTYLIRKVTQRAKHKN